MGSSGGPGDPADPNAATIAAPIGGAMEVSTHASSSIQAFAPRIAERYELLGLLGAGAMGTVYRARDRELDELVAIKVLKKELIGAAGMLDRFRREVKLARRVTHRNVARTYDIGEAAGDRFLTMEFIDGDALSNLLARRRRLRVGEALGIAHDVCSGLAAAHGANVLHRDLKPANVIVAKDGRAVITDFGIARALAEAEMVRTSGGLVGTPAYMAPEQVEGAIDLDARADLYALGTMLFELLTGEMAWEGGSMVAIAAARLMRPPPDVRSKAPDVPESVALLVQKLMARHRGDRCSSAAEALAQLDAVRASLTTEAPARSAVHGVSGVVGVPRARGGRAVGKKVAVLPILNSGGEDDDYLADGATEDLVDLLSVVPELRVRPRGQAAHFADRARDVREAGRVLGVDVVVDGSLRRNGDSVTIKLRLVTVGDGFLLWARRFVRTAALVLEIAEEAAKEIASALTTELAIPQRASALDETAQELYLRGRFLMQRGWFEIAREAVKLLREAYTRAPDDPRIAGTYALAVAKDYVNDGDGAPPADDVLGIATRALDLDPTRPEPRLALGLLHSANGEHASATQRLLDALEVAPNSIETLEMLGRLLSEAGDIERGNELLNRCLALEPQLAHPPILLARNRALLGDYEGFLDALGPRPSHPGDLVVWFVIHARVLLWHRDAALEDSIAAALAESAGRLLPQARRAIDGLVEVARAERLDDAGVSLVKAQLPLEGLTRRRACLNAQLLSEVLAARGRVEEALAVLGKASDLGLVDIAWLDRCDALDRLRDRPELAPLRRATKARADAVLAVVDARRSILGA